MHNIKRDARHILGVGMSGMGKTGYGERYIIGSHHSRVLIYDHQGEFQQRLNLFPVKNFEEVARRLPNERILCFDYSFEYRGQLEECFAYFCSQVFDICKDELVPLGKEALFVCDEIQKCLGPNTLPQPFKDIIQTGRRFNLDTLSLSQQPNELHNSLRNQVTEFVSFKLQDARALKWVDEMGMPVDKIAKLPKLNYYWKNTHTGEERDGKISYSDHREKPS